MSSKRAASPTTLLTVRFGSLAEILTSPRYDRFTLQNGRWTAHPSQHFGYAFMSALVDAGEEIAACALVRNPILTEEFEKLAQSWLRLAKKLRSEAIVPAPPAAGSWLARRSESARPDIAMTPEIDLAIPGSVKTPPTVGMTTIDLLNHGDPEGALLECADGVERSQLASCAVSVRAKTAATRSANFVRFM